MTGFEIIKLCLSLSVAPVYILLFDVIGLTMLTLFIARDTTPLVFKDQALNLFHILNYMSFVHELTLSVCLCLTFVRNAFIPRLNFRKSVTVSVCLCQFLFSSYCLLLFYA